MQDRSDDITDRDDASKDDSEATKQLKDVSAKPGRRRDYLSALLDMAAVDYDHEGARLREDWRLAREYDRGVRSNRHTSAAMRFAGELPAGLGRDPEDNDS